VNLFAAEATQEFEDALRSRLRHLLHLPPTTDDLTSRAARKEWAQWSTPEQWADAQTRIEETNADA
jgi:hypothetical protein